MIKKIKTSSGFEMEIETDVMNDMRIIESVAGLARGTDPLAIVEISHKVLGEDRERLYDHLAEEDGRVPIDKASEEITEIMKLCGEQGKNS